MIGRSVAAAAPRRWSQLQRHRRPSVSARTSAQAAVSERVVRRVLGAHDERDAMDGDAVAQRLRSLTVQRVTDVPRYSALHSQQSRAGNRMPDGRRRQLVPAHVVFAAPAISKARSNNGSSTGAAPFSDRERLQEGSSTQLRRLLALEQRQSTPRMRHGSEQQSKHRRPPHARGDAAKRASASTDDDEVSDDVLRRARERFADMQRAHSRSSSRAQVGGDAMDAAMLVSRGVHYRSDEERRARLRDSMRARSRRRAKDAQRSSNDSTAGGLGAAVLPMYHPCLLQTPTRACPSPALCPYTKFPARTCLAELKFGVCRKHVESASCPWQHSAATSPGLARGSAAPLPASNGEALASDPPLVTTAVLALISLFQLSAERAATASWRPGAGGLCISVSAARRVVEEVFYCKMAFQPQFRDAFVAPLGVAAVGCSGDDDASAKFSFGGAAAAECEVAELMLEMATGEDQQRGGVDVDDRYAREAASDRGRGIADAPGLQRASENEATELADISAAVADEAQRVLTFVLQAHAALFSLEGAANDTIILSAPLRESILAEGEADTSRAATPFAIVSAFADNEIFTAAAKAAFDVVEGGGVGDEEAAPLWPAYSMLLTHGLRGIADLAVQLTTGRARVPALAVARNLTAALRFASARSEATVEAAARVLLEWFVGLSRLEGTQREAAETQRRRFADPVWHQSALWDQRLHLGCGDDAANKASIEVRYRAEWAASLAVLHLLCFGANAFGSAELVDCVDAVFALIEQLALLLERHRRPLAEKKGVPACNGSAGHLDTAEDGDDGERCAFNPWLVGIGGEASDALFHPDVIYHSFKGRALNALAVHVATFAPELRHLTPPTSSLLVQRQSAASHAPPRVPIVQVHASLMMIVTELQRMGERTARAVEAARRAEENKAAAAHQLKLNAARTPEAIKRLQDAFKKRLLPWQQAPVIRRLLTPTTVSVSGPVTALVLCASMRVKPQRAFRLAKGILSANVMLRKASRAADPIAYQVRKLHYKRFRQRGTGKRKLKVFMAAVDRVHDPSRELLSEHDVASARVKLSLVFHLSPSAVAELVEVLAAFLPTRAKQLWTVAAAGHVRTFDLCALRSEPCLLDELPALAVRPPPGIGEGAATAISGAQRGAEGLCLRVAADACVARAVVQHLCRANETSLIALTRQCVAEPALQAARPHLLVPTPLIVTASVGEVPVAMVSLSVSIFASLLAANPVAARVVFRAFRDAASGALPQVPGGDIAATLDERLTRALRDPAFVVRKETTDLWKVLVPHLVSQSGSEASARDANFALCIALARIPTASAWRAFLGPRIAEALLEQFSGSSRAAHRSLQEQRVAESTADEEEAGLLRADELRVLARLASSSSCGEAALEAAAAAGSSSDGSGLAAAAVVNAILLAPALHAADPPGGDAEAKRGDPLEAFWAVLEAGLANAGAQRTSPEANDDDVSGSRALSARVSLARLILGFATVCCARDAANATVQECARDLLSGLLIDEATCMLLFDASARRGADRGAATSVFIFASLMTLLRCTQPSFAAVDQRVWAAARVLLGAREAALVKDALEAALSLAKRRRTPLAHAPQLTDSFCCAAEALLAKARDVQLRAFVGSIVQVLAAAGSSLPLHKLTKLCKP